ncbi:xylose ABC transporter ATP-binding protein [Oceanobacillus alkalisoli]|uniref:xylose ABC transporter ATP-binding protein n=1 Tax=Oceanobacillus alkalisoli TaxID=2925113 RepID=UPI001F119D2B|nr:xylose ABC transporter ATP-binding protein [Oceanobacillus alkalisoli]MCF3942800.1 xylose ABC transporter ATP-binding protein [Oceanobacillus alkalisoli]
MMNITKEFPGVKALENVNLKVKKGEVHALCGENGAGKSTLMKILSGVYPFGSYIGEIFINDREVQFLDIKASQEAGVAIIYQELALVPEMTVAENIFLGSDLMRSGIISWEKLYAESQKWLDMTGLDIDPQMKLGDLTVGKQQLVEITKALTKNADILILDEPTSALTESEAEVLFSILARLKERNVTCIYISHKLDEVLKIADSVTVLRDGQTVSTDPISNLTENDIVSKMVGRELTEFYPFEERPFGNEIFRVNNYSFYENETQEELVANVSFNLRKGEILGVSGLMGAGRTELFISLFGGYNGKKTGEVYLENELISINKPADSIKHGIAYVSEDRKRYGLVPEMNIIKNTTLASLDKVKKNRLLDADMELEKAEEYAKKMNLKSHSLEAFMSQLSGGNQQKVVLSKWLLTNPKVLILDEPTRGIDVGAKFEIYKVIVELAKEGVGIVLISSELPEVLGMSDRVMVMSEGRITGELPRTKATQEEIMKLATIGSDI